MIVVSRGVRCGIVSTPVKRSIATEAMIPLIRARARGLSLTSRNCARPESRTARAVSISASGLAPSGGSTCTEIANSPSRRSRSSRVSPVAGSNGATCLRSRTRKEPAGLRPASTASRIAAIWAGVVPQQPPITRAPSARACAANSAK